MPVFTAVCELLLFLLLAGPANGTWSGRAECGLSRCATGLKGNGFLGAGVVQQYIFDTRWQPGELVSFKSKCLQLSVMAHSAV